MKFEVGDFVTRTAGIYKGRKLRVTGTSVDSDSGAALYRVKRPDGRSLVYPANWLVHWGHDSSRDEGAFYRYDNPVSRYRGESCQIIQERPCGDKARVAFEDGVTFIVRREHLTRLDRARPTNNSPEEPTMPSTSNVDSDTVIEFETVTFVSGTSLDDLKEEDVAALLVNTQAEVDRIKSLPRRTKKMAARVFELEANMDQLINTINKRDAKPTLEDRVAKLEAAVSPTDK